MKMTLHVWRQANAKAKGDFTTYELDDVSPDSSFLETLDVLNETLLEKGEEPIAFDHDCREGICGSCGLMLNGHAHGHREATTTCQLHMREFNDGDEVYVEPWRARAFPVIKDLAVDRSAFDRVIQAGGYVSINTGSAQDANETPIAKKIADEAFDAATCIGCGACVASCPNASASLFTSAKIGHLSLLPQGQAERGDRVRKMVAQMEADAFGGCTNHGECEAACPKGISVDWIARMNADYLKASLAERNTVNTR
ncbi:MAG: succinate dehydrogenase/fumarate reductase iron-sulfur subunit [Myxococcota bacterium]|nr:succinate dehydrogenase/fumarate reductase iron-sulfur subunit [Myxococcota bacterium]